MAELDRECGGLPGVNAWPVAAGPRPSAEASRNYDLGVGLPLGSFRVCYCHGACTDATGNVEYANFCRDVGTVLLNPANQNQERA